MPKGKINDEEKDIQGKIIADINTFVPTSITDFIEDHEEDPEAIFRLVVTLKHWANPLGAYECALSQNDLDDYFKVLQSIVKNPKLILPNADLTEKEEQLAREVLHIKLNKESDDLIQKYHFNERIIAKMNNRDKAEQWWKNKKDEEKKLIQSKYESLDEKQLQYIKKRSPTKTIYIGNTDPFLYYLMCNDVARINLILLEDSIRATAYLGRAVVQGVTSLTNNIGGGSSGGGGGSSGGGGNNDGFLFFVGIVGFIAIITSGLIAGAYALKKMYNSLVNLSEHKKVLRSLFRIGSIGIGGYYGTVGFASLGALLGSFVPGIGTAAGAIIGGFFGTGIGMGLGATAGKYIAKALSYIMYNNENNPSNPEKYQLTEAETANLIREHLDIKTINRMLRAAKKEKNSVGIMGSWPDSKEREHKNLWNKKIKLIKSGKIDKLEIAGRVYNARFNELGKPYFEEQSRSSTAIFYDGLNIPKEIPAKIPSMLVDKSEDNIQWPLQPVPSAPMGDFSYTR